MDQNNNNKKPGGPGGGKNSNWRGFIHLICWAVLTPILDAVLYGAPYGQMLLQGLVNAALNAFVTAVAGTLLCFFCSAFRRRKARQKRSRPVAAGKPE